MVITDHTSINLGTINPYRYRGYRYDEESKLYYLQSRYYNPEIQRFISLDDISYLDPSQSTGLNLYAYTGNNPVMFMDDSGNSPVPWWNWAISGAQLALGIGLMFVPGAQVFGVGLIVSGGSMLASNAMSVMGLDDKLSMQIQSALSVIAGIGLSFVPGMGAFGASMIGAGIGSFAGGYISEAFGGSYGLGWGIGNIVGSIAGGMVYKGVINRLNTPARMMRSFENHPQRWKLISQDVSPATGRVYRGGTSIYSYYRNIWTGGHLGTHVITRVGIIIHGPHFRPW
jgi:RHS repeat-associated protein